MKTMATPVLRLVTDAPQQAPSLRPTSFDDFIGQAAAIGVLRPSVAAAKRRGQPLDHALVTGGPGLGKTSLAAVVAAEMGAKLRCTTGVAIAHRGELAALLTSLEAGDVLFIDEIHGLARPLQEMLYTAMEDRRVDLFAGKKAISMDLPPFTLIGATTRAGQLAKPLLDRFGFHLQLQSYDFADLMQIALRSAAAMGATIDDDAATELARRSQGTPRILNRLLRRAIALAGAGPIDIPPACPLLGVDDGGLDDMGRRYLAVVAAGPVGIDAIASALGEERPTIEQVESQLVQAGLVRRTPRGRVATEAGRAHLEGTTAAEDDAADTLRMEAAS